MKMKRGDTRPDLVIKLTDNGLALDLTEAQQVRVVGRGVATFNDTTLDIDASSGTITRTWNPGETAKLGRILVEVEVTWGDSTVQSFPPDDFLTVDVVKDLG